MSNPYRHHSEAPPGAPARSHWKLSNNTRAVLLVVLGFTLQTWPFWLWFADVLSSEKALGASGVMLCGLIFGGMGFVELRDRSR